MGALAPDRALEFPPATDVDAPPFSTRPFLQERARRLLASRLPRIVRVAILGQELVNILKDLDDLLYAVDRS